MPLPNGAPYIVMPCTFGAGQRGPFSLGATSDDGDFELLPLPEKVPPAVKKVMMATTPLPRKAAFHFSQPRL